jgi:hypothetical protein
MASLMRDFDAVFCVVGGKGDLSDATLASVLRHLNTTVRTGTANAPIHLALDGYDDDSRELWEIPEVKAYVRRLILGLDLEVMSRLDPLSRILGSVCCGMLRPVGKDPVTGNTRFERTDL